MVTILAKLGTIINFVVLSTIDFLAISKSAKVSKNTLLLVRLDTIGDYVLFRNSIEALRKSEKYKHYKITLCGNIAWKELAETFDKKFIDEFIWINTKKLNRNPFYRYKTLRDISRMGFEVAIQPTYSREYYTGDTVIRASQAKEKTGSQGECGYMRPWQKRLSDRWYTRLIPASPRLTMELCRNAEFMRGLGLTSFCARVPVIDMAGGKTRLVKEREYYVLVPGALQKCKRWPVENFARLAEKIHDATGWAGVICGSKDEKKLGQNLKNLSRAPLHNIAGKTSLPELVRVVRDARLVIANDTGTVHIAAATGTAVVCILGGGHYGRFVPYQVEKEISCRLPVVVTHKMPCFNCNWQCKYETGKGAPLLCIKNISVEDVWAQVRILIEQIRTEQGSRRTHG
jgi:ADP-heptose:LPS heptosyltransferase